MMEAPRSKNTSRPLAPCALVAVVALFGCSTSRTVPYPYATVVASAERMYPAVPLVAQIYGDDPRGRGYQALGAPAAGVTRPEINGSPRLVRKREPMVGREFDIDLVDYRGRPSSIDATITLTARGAGATEIKVETRDWNTIDAELHGTPARDKKYERARLEEIISEIGRR